MVWYHNWEKSLQRDIRCFGRRMILYIENKLWERKDFQVSNPFCIIIIRLPNFINLNYWRELTHRSKNKEHFAHGIFIQSNVNKEPSDAVMGREYVLGNEDLLIGVVNPTEKMDYFYRNGEWG